MYRHTSVHLFQLLLPILLAIAVKVQAVPAFLNRRLAPTSFCWDSTDTVFVFGDSYSAIGGKAGSNATWNLFETEDAVKNDPIIINMTSAGGPNWNEYLVGCFEGLPQDCKPHRLFNLAYNGATVNEDLVKPWRPIIADFRKQTQLWKTHVVPKLQWTNALAMIWFGINDVIKTEQVPDNEIQGLFDKVLKTYFDQMDILYAQSMRQFMLVNAPPMDRAPKYASVRTHLAVRIQLFNTRFRTFIDRFRKLHPDTTLIQVDAHQIFSNLFDQHQVYGIQNVEGFYEQDSAGMALEQYFWNDELHPTYPVHRAFAAAVQNHLQNVSSCIPRDIQ